MHVTYLNFYQSFCCLDLGLTEGPSIFSTHISAHSQVWRLIKGLEGTKGNAIGILISFLPDNCIKHEVSQTFQKQ